MSLGLFFLFLFSLPLNLCAVDGSFIDAFYCRNYQGKINLSVLCDGQSDCLDSSDELFCQNGEFIGCYITKVSDDRLERDLTRRNHIIGECSQCLCSLNSDGCLNLTEKNPDIPCNYCVGLDFAFTMTTLQSECLFGIENSADAKFIQQLANVANVALFRGHWRCWDGRKLIECTHLVNPEPLLYSYEPPVVSNPLPVTGCISGFWYCEEAKKCIRRGRVSGQTCIFQDLQAPQSGTPCDMEVESKTNYAPESAICKFKACQDEQSYLCGERCIPVTTHCGNCYYCNISNACVSYESLCDNTCKGDRVRCANFPYRQQCRLLNEDKVINYGCEQVTINGSVSVVPSKLICQEDNQWPCPSKGRCISEKRPCDRKCKKGFILARRRVCKSSDSITVKIIEFPSTSTEGGENDGDCDAKTSRWCGRAGSRA